MADISLTGAITVPGYVKKTVYNGNIEYRNYNPDLVGLQLTSDGGTPLFTMGNFNITTNLDPKLNKNFITSQFSNFVSLENLDLTVEQTQVLLQNNAEVFLNLDRSKLSYYATFGSMTEFIRVSLENIIINWPASIYLTPIKVFSDGTQVVVNTCEEFSHDIITDTSTFRIPTNAITNRYNINYLTKGDISGTFNETNKLRNLIIDYASYAVSLNENEYDVIDFTGSTNIINDYVYFKVKGTPFTGTTSNITYHIKPKKIICDEFFNSLDEFEYYLLNRQSFPIYTATFKYPLRTDTGVLLYTNVSVTWPISDGYNLDFETTLYDNYATKLLELSNDNDLVNSNMMNRFLVSESITGFDTMPYYLSDEDQDTSGGKVNKLLNIYGRSYDDFNKYIEGISFANVVSYDKLDNTPDIYLKNIARVMGWGLIESVVSNDLLSDYVSASKSTYSGQSMGLTPSEADTELWRRIILNTPWIWKSKGTRKTIEFLLRFIGTPNGLITFNEYIYKVDNPIDVELFKTVLKLNGLDDDISLYPIDDEGYPRFFDDTDDMYFQGNGLWYRETSGANSVIDITDGNNPHIGPYDGGYKYFNQLMTLIPNFSAVTITSETITTTSYDLFTNYNSGDLTGYSGETYVDLLNYPSGTELGNCYNQTTTVILDPKPAPILTPCGCPIEKTDNSLSVCVEKVITPIEPLCPPVITANNVPYYVFTPSYVDANGNPTSVTYSTNFVSTECCSSKQGITMYNDSYVDELTNTITDPLIQSGYVCCKVGSTCACNVAKDWTISSTPVQLSDSQFYLSFITLEGYGNPIVVGADASLCPTNWATPIQNITDPYTGLVGVGCQILPNALPLLQSILLPAYQNKIQTGAGCEFIFPSATPPPTCLEPILNSVIRNVDNSYTLNWTFNGIDCGNGTVILKVSQDNGVTFTNLPLQTQVSPNSGTATTQANLTLADSLIFIIEINYQAGTNCQPPFVNCTTTSNTITYTAPIVEPPVDPPVVNVCTAPKFLNNTAFFRQSYDPEVFTTAIQSDGKIIAGGRFSNYISTTPNAYGIVRINPNGSKDTTFDTGGTSFKIPSSNLSYDIYSLAIQTDGKILVGGSFAYFNENPIQKGICRLNTNGTLDNTFNNGGVGLVGDVKSIAIQTDGKILIAGSFISYNGVSRYGLTRLNPDGTLDSSFPNLTMNSAATKVIIQPDNKIIVIGDFTTFNGDTNRKRIVRLLQDGTVESSSIFNYVDLTTSPTAISLQSDGKIIIAGIFTSIGGNPATRIARLNPNGSFDNTFLGSIPPLPGGNVGFTIKEIRTLSDNKLLIGGNTGYGCLFKLLSNGEFDTNFTSLGFNSASVVNTILPYCYEQKIIVGGNFDSYGTNSARSMTGINSDGSINQ
jgi:uncharacterized delta-60 repeat protein